MVGLVNYAKEPHSTELRELPVPEIGEEDILFKVQAVAIFKSNVTGFENGTMGAVDGRRSDGSPLEGLQTAEAWTGVTLALASEFATEGMQRAALQTAKSIYDVVYEQKGYWFRTPEAWDKAGNFRASMYLRPGVVWSIDYALGR